MSYWYIVAEVIELSKITYRVSGFRVAFYCYIYFLVCHEGM